MPWLVLGLIGILNGYLPALNGPDTPARSAAIDSLAARGAGGVAPLARALNLAGWRAREGILDALARIGPASVPLLAQTAHTHPRADVRRLAVRALGRVGGAAARDSLLHLLDTPARDLAVEALGEIGDPAAAPAVLRLLDDHVPDVRRRAVVALGKMVGAGAVEQMVDALSDGHHSVRFAASRALEAAGAPAARALLHRVDGLSGPARYLAIRTLGRLQYAPAKGFLEEALKAADDWSLRAAAAEALGALGERDCRGLLEKALQRERHPFVRERIRSSLKRIGGG